MAGGHNRLNPVFLMRKIFLFCSIVLLSTYVYTPAPYPGGPKGQCLHFEEKGDLSSLFLII